jgi:large subunit ribosomal protein L4
MSKISAIDIIHPVTGEIKKSDYKISEDFSSLDVSPKFLSSYVRLHNFRSHTGSSKTKGIADVSGGGRKPHKQKGLGRARAGSIRSSLWRGGAKIFGGFKESSTYAVNMSKKDRRLGFDMSLALRISEGNVVALDGFDFDIKKDKLSKDFLNFIKGSNVLFVFDDDVSFDFMMKIRNRPNVFFALDNFVNVHDLLKYDKIVVCKSVFDKWNALRLCEVS